jgi:hypothetical protein
VVAVAAVAAIPAALSCLASTMRPRVSTWSSAFTEAAKNATIRAH